MDRTILIITLILLIIGTIMVYSSTSVPKDGETPSFYYLTKHLLTAFIGIVLMFIFAFISLDTIRRSAIPLLIISFVLLLLVFTDLGVSAGGARRWIRLWPTMFQPSELAKLSMVIFISWFASRKDFDPHSFRSFIIPVVVMGLFQIVFIKQPDFGAFMSLGVLTLSMMFLSGVRLRYLFSLGTIMIPLIIYLIHEPYRWRRIISFLDPWKDQTGAGFQLVQSLIAFGSGGLFGVGIGNSKQKLSYLPAIHNDFIFSLIGEETGFIGAICVVILFLLIFLKGVSIGTRADDSFSYFLAYGISLMIGLQAIINFAVTTGIAPTKGLPLPFISYGGSSLVTNLCAVGILLNISRNNILTGRKGMDTGGLRNTKRREIIIRRRHLRERFK